MLNCVSVKKRSVRTFFTQPIYELDFLFLAADQSSFGETQDIFPPKLIFMVNTSESYEEFNFSIMPSHA